MDDKKIVVPIVVIEHKQSGFEIYSPDFDMSVYGVDYITALASVTHKMSAIYYYNLERNYKFKLKTTYEDAEKIAGGKPNRFVTFTTLIA